jgi:predicted nucleotidyltransferase
VTLDVATRLARDVQTILDENLVAVILHGSLVLDAFVPGQSDVDLLIVVADPLSEDDTAALRDAAAATGSSVDLRVVTEDTASAPSVSPVVELGVELHESYSYANSGAVERDLLVELSLARARGRSLLGPPPDEVLGAVPDDWVVAYGDELLGQWVGRIGEVEQTDQMTFAACRIWRFAAERVHCSKTAAAGWALERDPALVAVDEALLGHRPARTDLGILLARVRNELPRLARRSPRAAR